MQTRETFDIDRSKHIRGKKILWDLLAKADVFIQGFRTGVTEKLGFGYKEVSEKHPELIYCSSTGFGETGPYSNLPAMTRSFRDSQAGLEFS